MNRKKLQVIVKAESLAWTTRSGPATKFQNIALASGQPGKPIVEAPGTRHEIRRTLDHMATSGNRGGGQRSKGDRRFVGSRVPVDVYDRLAQTAKAENLTVSEFVAALIGEKLGPEGPKSLRLQGELPIGRIA